MPGTKRGSAGGCEGGAPWWIPGAGCDAQFLPTPTPPETPATAACRQGAPRRAPTGVQPRPDRPVAYLGRHQHILGSSICKFLKGMKKIGKNGPVRCFYATDMNPGVFRQGPAAVGHRQIRPLLKYRCPQQRARTAMSFAIVIKPTLVSFRMAASLTPPAISHE